MEDEYLDGWGLGCMAGESRWVNLRVSVRMMSIVLGLWMSMWMNR